MTEESQHQAGADNLAAQVSQAWNRVRAELTAEQRVWLNDSKPLTLHENTLMVAVPNEFARERLETVRRCLRSPARSGVYPAAAGDQDKKQSRGEI